MISESGTDLFLGDTFPRVGTVTSNVAFSNAMVPSELSADVMSTRLSRPENLCFSHTA